VSNAIKGLGFEIHKKEILLTSWSITNTD
jgi:hypothetical protein